MKLRNKKTGEIRYCSVINNNLAQSEGEWTVSSLAELNEEWEDYKEDVHYYSITMNGVIRSLDVDTSIDKFSKEIGNYFETEEEAEKAVEKLKAWKRLKDKGFRFVGRRIKDLSIVYSFDNYDKTDIPQMEKDLDLLFGGED